MKTALIILIILTIANTICIGYLYHVANVMSCIELKQTQLIKELAGLINKLWQDLTDAERKQIRNILESEVRE